MILICIKQPLRIIKDLIYYKVKQHWGWGKMLLIKKSECAAKLHKVYVIYLILIEGFNIMVRQNVSTNLTVTYSYEFQKFLTQAFL